MRNAVDAPPDRPRRKHAAMRHPVALPPAGSLRSARAWCGRRRGRSPTAGCPARPSTTRGSGPSRCAPGPARARASRRCRSSACQVVPDVARSTYAPYLTRWSTLGAYQAGDLVVGHAVCDEQCRRRRTTTCQVAELSEAVGHAPMGARRRRGRTHGLEDLWTTGRSHGGRLRARVSHLPARDLGCSVRDGPRISGELPRRANENYIDVVRKPTRRTKVKKLRKVFPV